MDNVLIRDDNKQYRGRYVAFRSFSNREIICYGKTPVKVLKTAAKMGVSSPVLFFVPKKNMANFY